MIIPLFKGGRGGSQFVISLLGALKVRSSKNSLHKKELAVFYVTVAAATCFSFIFKT